MLALRTDTPPAWLEAVKTDLTAFLQDHAANERKVVQSALQLAAHYPTRPGLPAAMAELAAEELSHFDAVRALVESRGATLDFDRPDPYIARLRQHFRKEDANAYLLDRLVLFAIIEARGCERFSILADGLPDGDVRAFYRDLVRSEARHHALFLRLARAFFDPEVVRARTDALLDIEAAIVRDLPVRAALH
jgi:tRNA-(ms[2]io[6]A)-hydroxylase